MTLLCTWLILTRTDCWEKWNYGKQCTSCDSPAFHPGNSHVHLNQTCRKYTVCPKWCLLHLELLGVERSFEDTHGFFVLPLPQDGCRVRLMMMYCMAWVWCEIIAFDLFSFKPELWHSGIDKLSSLSNDKLNSLSLLPWIMSITELYIWDMPRQPA